MFPSRSRVGCEWGFALLGWMTRLERRTVCLVGASKAAPHFSRGRFSPPLRRHAVRIGALVSRFLFAAPGVGRLSECSVTQLKVHRRGWKF
jgi:hypothetical protein